VVVQAVALAVEVLAVAQAVREDPEAADLDPEAVAEALEAAGLDPEAVAEALAAPEVAPEVEAAPDQAAA
jgi:2-hydroxychromene-2-carboxylate isomerase